MIRKLTRNLVVLVISFLLVSQLFIGQAQASWGAAKLFELLQQQNGSPVIPQPTLPPIPEPTPEPKPTPIPEPTPVPEDPNSEQDNYSALSSQEREMLQLVNEERVKNGLKPLVLMPELTELARLKSKDIIKYNYFAHTSPTYGSFAKMVSDAGIRFYSVGENLAKARNAKHAFYLFMGSSGHKANMLNPNFTHVGIGIVQDKYGVVVTQLFIMK